jgi:uncharacterized protein YjbI with pentapeptide repeats
MTNPTPTASQRVRFEEITPTNEIVAYFNTQLSDLVAARKLPILQGYDDLDNLLFSFVTLPSGNTVVLGQYENGPETGVDLYVDFNPKQNPNTTADKIPDLVIETCQYLAIPRSIAIWLHPDYEVAIDKSYPSEEEIAKRSELLQSRKILIDGESAPLDREPIECFYYALEIYSRERIPEYWAMLQHNLGLAYYHRDRGERWRNLQESIACFNRSLEVFTQDEFPKKWQMSREDLGRSIAEWEVERQSLIRDILDRPGETSNLSGANLYEADLSGADLSGANLYGVNLSRADLRGAKLIGSFLTRADLIEADLIEANLHKTNLYRTNLCGANLREANLREADLCGANLREADLSGSDLIGANVENTIFGNNIGISETMRQDLISRGAIFEDLPGDRSSSLTPVGR